MPLSRGSTLALLRRLAALVHMERPLLRLLFVYSGAAALFSLIVPLTIQELVNTFSYAIQSMMVFVLSAMMIGILLMVGGMKVLQYCAVEMLERRVFARIAVGFVRSVPRVALEALRPKDVNVFVETVFLQRAISTLLVDLVNIGVGSIVGMGILILYHPYFAFFDVLLFLGSVFVGLALAHGGFLATLEMSDAKYAVLNWIQEVANNHLFFKIIGSQTLALRRIDALLQAYLAKRRQRFRALIRQYAGSVVWQALVHGGLLGMAGWLVAADQLTIGQLVGAEVIVAGLLVNLDTVIKQMSHVFYLFTAATELDEFFLNPKDDNTKGVPLPMDPAGGVGIHISIRSFACTDDLGKLAFEPCSMEVQPGERIAVLAESNESRKAFVYGLVGLRVAAGGAVYYNGVDLPDLDQTALFKRVGVVFDYPPTLIEGSLEDNIVMGNDTVTHDDVQWALRVVDLGSKIDSLPLGLRTPVERRGKAFSNQLVVQVMLARVIVARPSLLVLEGGLSLLSGVLQDRLLRRLLSKEMPWSVILVTSDRNHSKYAGRHLILRSVKG